MFGKSLCVLSLFVSAALCDEKQPELDVPYEPTHPEVVVTMLEAAGITSKDTVYDLGCGDGRIVILAAQQFGARGVGFDIDPQRIREAEENAQFAGVTGQVKFQRCDILDADISRATIVTLYLLDSVNLMIRPKLFEELQPGTRIASHAFHMDDWQSDQKITHEKARNDVIYTWVIPAAAGGTWEWRENANSGESGSNLKLEQQFQKVNGSFISPQFGTSPIKDGALTGRKLSVKSSVLVEGKPVDVVFQGVITGDSIKGTQEWKSGPFKGKWQWGAKRRPVPLLGDWRIAVDSSEENLNGVLRLSRAGKKIKGVYIVEEDKSEAEVTALYLWGSSARFEIPTDDEPLVFTGSFDGNSGRGKVDKKEWDADLSWSARRLKKKS